LKLHDFAGFHQYCSVSGPEECLTF